MDRGEYRRLPPAASPEQYLHSWKSIAAYLGREERTVRRWEKTEDLPVHRLHHAKGGSVYAIRSELDHWRAQRSGDAPRPPDHSPIDVTRRRFWIALGASTLVLSLGVWLAASSRSDQSAWPIPLTGNAGTELEPRMAPDGSRIAFVWDGNHERNFDIYVRDTESKRTTRLTVDPAPEYSPAWSPDGSRIAFLRQAHPARSEVVIAPAEGGPDTVLTELDVAAWPDWSRLGPHLAWSPNGKWLIAVGRLPPSSVDRLLRIPIHGGSPEPLTSPPANIGGDYSPALSPDGRTLAFTRKMSWSVSKLWLMPVSEELTPAGDPSEVDTGAPWNATPAWTPDRRSLIFSTGRMDATHLARVRLDKKHIDRLSGVGAYGMQPSLARASGGRLILAYTEHFEEVNIWRLKRDGTGDPAPLISSAHWSYEPDYSPDGKRIAFISDRTGYPEIWVSAADGSEVQQWTFLRRPSLGSPKWSPDGGRLAFSSLDGEASSIFDMQGPGAKPDRVRGSQRCGYFSWSPDGSFIYFSSDRTGVGQIWKVPSRGGEAVQVTTGGGRVPVVSKDGRYVYYLKQSPDGAGRLFRLSEADGREEPVLEFVDAYALAPGGIVFKYYRRALNERPFLAFQGFEAASWTPILKSPELLRYGIAVSPDGASVLYSVSAHTASEVKLVDSFY